MSLEKDLEILKAENRSTEKKVDRILFYLENDGATGSKGLVAEMAQIKIDGARVEAKIDSFVTEYQKSQAVKKATLTVWGFVGTGVFLICKFLVEKIFF